MIDLIKAATLTNDPELQKQAEMALLKHRNEQPEDFFLQNAKIVNSSDTPTAIRQAAGTLLAVSLKVKNGQSYLWYVLSAPSRSNFKEMVLSTMIDRQKLIRRAAANIVATICCMEIPRNQWPGIAQKITHNISSDDLIVKEVSILTIGFICEQLKDFDFYFQESLQETIITGILMGIKDNHMEVAETAFKALRDGLQAMPQIMKNNQYREYLISQIVQAISRQAFLDYCLQSLIEFVRCYYSYLQPQYIEVIANKIDPIMQNTKDENVCVMAMEFWSTLAREEKNIESNPNLMKFITGQLGDKIVQTLLQNLCAIEEHDEEANGVSEGAASALQAIFQGDSQEFEVKILSFTSNAIHHQNWKYRQASIRAFSLLLIGLPSERSQVLVNSSLLQLVALLNDPVQYVQLSAIKSLSLISQQVPQVILHHKQFLQILDFVVKMGHSQIFLKHASKVVDNLTASDESVKIIGPHADKMVKVFLQFCEEDGRQLSSISSCLNVIINLIRCSMNVTLCNDYIQYVLNTYSKIHGLEREKRDLFYSGFFTMAQVCLMTIRKADGTITMQQMSSLYNLVVQHYKRINDVEGDGFYIVSALAYFVDKDRRLIDDFWKYIEYGLKKLSQQQIFKSTISCICDFATIYRQQITDKIDPIINEILELYESNKITRDLKLDVLMCIGELFLQCGHFCGKHLKRVMALLLLSCEGVIAVSTSDLNYAETLQESIIETLMCIFHGSNEQFLKGQLSAYLPFILEFIKITTDKKKHPKLTYVKDCLMLLADVSNIFPDLTQTLLNAGFIGDRASVLVRFNKDGHLSQNISYVKQQFHLSII